MLNRGKGHGVAVGVGILYNINPMTSIWGVSHPSGGSVSVSKSSFLLQYCLFRTPMLVHLPTTTLYFTKFQAMLLELRYLD